MCKQIQFVLSRQQTFRNKLMISLTNRAGELVTQCSAGLFMPRVCSRCEFLRHETELLFYCYRFVEYNAMLAVVPLTLPPTTN